MRAGPALVLAAALAAAPAAAQEEGAGSGLPSQLYSGGLVLYNDTGAPMSFVALPAKPASAEDAGEVRGKACQNGLYIPVLSVSGAIGDGGYARAMARIHKERPELTGVYDVRVDLRLLSIMGIFRRLCVEVTARGFR